MEHFEHRTSREIIFVEKLLSLQEKSVFFCACSYPHKSSITANGKMNSSILIGRLVSYSIASSISGH